jgi:hypothetical protein
MKKFDLNNFMFGFFAIALISIGIWITYIIINNDDKATPPKQELKIQKNIDEPVKPDTITAMNNPWPIRVESVEKSYEKNTPKWQVVTENGVMYYTNKKPKIGDIAFYINNNDNITDRNGNRMERTR